MIAIPTTWRYKTPYEISNSVLSLSPELLTCENTKRVLPQSSRVTHVHTVIPPPDSLLSKDEGIKHVFLVIPPNLNPDLPDVSESHEQALRELRIMYDNMLMAFSEMTKNPPPDVAQDACWCFMSPSLRKFAQSILTNMCQN